ncbi:Zinc/iron permease [Fennellomyces sp. T-0311]|nr:Zinc/iron permease [Fennellomyces sp. T-0311]
MNDDLQGWLLVLVSSLACILGASVVFIDKLWSAGHGSSILESRPFLSASMALASGVLLFSSLAVLLPASRNRLGPSSAYLQYACFFGGALFTLCLTTVIHYLTPDAIHACGGPPSPVQSADEEHGADTHHHDDRHHQNNVENHDEHQPIKHHHHHHYGTTDAHVLREAHFRFHPHHHEECHDEDHHTSQEDHQHFLRIGIQTAVAISVHKFPEGLIMFVSNQASTKLGWSVAAAMSIHNLTEGFMIALPLYFALRSRMAAFGWAALLGGLSQPIGAVLGLLLMHNIDESQENLMFGIVFALVSGMMTLITIQSMLPQAIKADTEHRYVLPFFFLGIFFVGLTAILKSL